MRIEVEKKAAASSTFWGWIVAIIAILALIWMVAEFAG
jgi:hypothetical protein